MSSVLSTLLDNAVKYSGKQVTIALEARQDGDKTCISIADNGIGIAPRDQIHIFEKFYRSPAVRRENIPGLGLGLSYVKSLVEAHRGHIRVESEPNRGTTFYISIPQ